MTMLSGVRAFAESIQLPVRPINEVSMIFNHLLRDNPIVFYTSSFSLSTEMHRKRCYFNPEYKYSRQFSKEHMNVISDYLRIFDPAKGKSDFEKELYVHDYCLSNFRYDYTFSDYSYTPLGLVLNGTAVCEGISKFVKLALDYLGIRNLVVSGKAKNPVNDNKTEGHAWNIVRIDGKLYHLDVTFDMTLKNKMNRYDYFNLSDDDIKKDHIITSEAPKCVTVGGDYYSRKALTAPNPADLAALIERNLKSGKTHFIVRLEGASSSGKIADRVMQIAVDKYMSVYRKSASLELGYNSSQMVFEIDFG